MSIEFTNNASGTNSIDILGDGGPEDLTITLQANEGQLFPSVTTASGDFFYATIEDTAGNVEIVRVTDNVSDILTVTRAQENTLSQDFATGSKVEQRTTAATFDEFLQRSGDTLTGNLDADGFELQDAQLTNPGAAGSLQGYPIRGSDDGTANELIVPSAGGPPTIGPSGSREEIYHQGNDGVGSGLDADLLDGLQGTAYIKPADDPVAPTGDWTFTGDTILDGDHTEVGFGTGGKVKDGGDVAQPIGYNVMPVTTQNASATISLSVNGHLILKTSTAAADYTLPNDSDIPQGATWTIVTDTSGIAAEAFRIKGDTGVFVRYFNQIDEVVTEVEAGNGFTFTDATIATVYKYNDTTYFLWGGSITEAA
jgi:hypothetical protein